MSDRIVWQYKPSGFQWLGSLPSHWRTMRIKHTTYVKGRIGWQGLRSDEFIDVGPILVTGTDFREGKVDWETCYHISEERYREDPNIQLQEGDLLITKDGTIGKIALVKRMPQPASVNSGILVTRPRAGNYDNMFMYWLLASPVFQNFIDVQKSGTTILHLYQNVFVEFAYPVPPLEEQCAIADFLDRKIERLDQLITRKKRFRELIDQSRRAVVSAAVTRGLIDVPLKPSGIEWFGAVPRHWSLNRLGRLCEEINDINHEMPEAVADGVPLLSAKDLKDDGSLNFTDDVKLISRDAFARLGKKIVPRRDDIVYSRYGACLGKARLVEVDREFLVSYSCVIIRLDKRVADPKFFMHLLDSDLVLIDAGLRTQGIAVPDLGNKMIAKFQVPVPPIEEQREIAKWLDKEVSGLRRAADSIQSGIERLQEFRAALISAAVTGKIDVRNRRPQEATAVCQ
jgi:type I restriction enzyme S subunit